MNVRNHEPGHTGASRRQNINYNISGPPSPLISNKHLYATLVRHSSSLHTASPLSVFVHLGMRMALAIGLDGTRINDFFEGDSLGGVWKTSGDDD